MADFGFRDFFPGTQHNSEFFFHFYLSVSQGVFRAFPDRIWKKNKLLFLVIRWKPAAKMGSFPLAVPEIHDGHLDSLPEEQYTTL